MRNKLKLFAAYKILTRLYLSVSSVLLDWIFLRYQTTPAQDLMIFHVVHNICA